MYLQKEKELFKRIKGKNKEDLWIWNLSNVGFPLFTFIVTIIIFSYTAKADCFDNYVALVLNGVLPLIAINTLVAASFFLIKFNRQKEKQYGLETSYTRLKLIIYAFLSYLFSSSLFVTQTILSPFENNLPRISQFLFSALAIYLALNISNKLFLLQEEMIQKSYDEDIVDKVKDLKNAIT